jgi:hypothetical protein
MRYYILYPNDTKEDAIKDDRQLGEDNGFGVFWAADGFRIFKKIIDTGHDDINHISIVTERGKYLTAEEFLDTISKLKVRIQS